jgi:hypothetical protein
LERERERYEKADFRFIADGSSYSGAIGSDGSGDTLGAVRIEVDRGPGSEQATGEEAFQDR